MSMLPIPLGAVQWTCPNEYGNGHDTTWRNSRRARSQKSRSNRRKAMRRKHK